MLRSSFRKIDKTLLALVDRNSVKNSRSVRFQDGPISSGGLSGTFTMSNGWGKGTNDLSASRSDDAVAGLKRSRRKNVHST